MENSVIQEYEIDDITMKILNTNLIKALFDLLYKRELINKKEHSQLIKEAEMPL